MWDLAIDKGSGDLIFGPNLDLIGVTGTNLTEQRIFIRCKVPRGTWIYDEDGTLGSRLHQVMRLPSDRQLRDASAIVQEALEPMDDISISDIQAEVNENNQLSITVKYRPTVTGDEGGDLPTVQFPEYDATVTV